MVFFFVLASTPSQTQKLVCQLAAGRGLSPRGSAPRDPTLLVGRIDKLSPAALQYWVECAAPPLMGAFFAHVPAAFDPGRKRDQGRSKDWTATNAHRATIMGRIWPTILAETRTRLQTGHFQPFTANPRMLAHICTSAETIPCSRELASWTQFETFLTWM